MPRLRMFETVSPASATRLESFRDFAPNPGDLDTLTYIPADLPARAPLVVVLHGCTQNAAVYDRGSGWSALADEHGFALLYAEQRRGNNPNGCFNWFEADDTTRGSGEAASIAAMTNAVVTAHGLDSSRVFVTGLSAGGAMTAVMLATYPDIYAGGAVIAGLPYGLAHGVSEALSEMSRPAQRSGHSLGQPVRAATTFTGPWPRISVWHGDADRTVAAANGDGVARQWVDVHGLSNAAPTVEQVGSQPVRRWRDTSGVAQVEAWAIPGIGHGTPIEAATGGAVGAHFLEAGIGSSAHIAAFWGVAPAVAAVAAAKIDPRATVAPTPFRPAPRAGVVNSVSDTINSALRAAGLLS